MSATWFIASESPRSSARRLARKALSSAITSTSSKKRSTEVRADDSERAAGLFGRGIHAAAVGIDATDLPVCPGDGEDQQAHRHDEPKARAPREEERQAGRTAGKVRFETSAVLDVAGEGGLDVGDGAPAFTAHVRAGNRLPHVRYL